MKWVIVRAAYEDQSAFAHNFLANARDCLRITDVLQQIREQYGAKASASERRGEFRVKYVSDQVDTGGTFQIGMYYFKSRLLKRGEKEIMDVRPSHFPKFGGGRSEVQHRRRRCGPSPFNGRAKPFGLQFSHLSFLCYSKYREILNRFSDYYVTI